MFESHLLSTNYEPGTVFGTKVQRKTSHLVCPQGAQSLESKKPHLGQVRGLELSELKEESSFKNISI